MGRKVYKALTEQVVQRVCESIGLGMSTKGACEEVGVSYNTLEQYTTEKVGENEEVRRPDWKNMLSGARAGCERYWLEVLRDPKVSNPLVKAAQIMLGALQPDRYRERPQVQTAGGILVQFIQGESGEIVDAKVLQIGPKQGKKAIQRADGADKETPELPETLVDA